MTKFISPKSSEGPESLGGRLPLLQPDDLSADQTRLYNRLQADMVPWAEEAGFQATLDDGRMIGPFNSILFSPAIGEAFLALQRSEQQHTSLNERMRQVVILTVGAAWECDYERYAHAAAAGKTGLPTAAIYDLSRGELAKGLSREESLAQRLTWQLARTRGFEPDLYEEARQTFDHKTMVDLLALAGIYGFVCGLLNGFAIPAPPSRP